jgi:hypothetical protein
MFNCKHVSRDYLGVCPAVDMQLNTSPSKQYLETAVEHRPTNGHSYLQHQLALSFPAIGHDHFHHELPNAVV